MAQIIKVSGASEGGPGKMVGVLLQESQHTYLTLYSLAYGYTKTKVLRQGVLDSWFAKVKEEMSEGDLVELLARRVYKEHGEPISTVSQSWFPTVAFQDGLVVELQHRGLPEPMAKDVLGALLRFCIRKRDGKDEEK